MKRYAAFLLLLIFLSILLNGCGETFRGMAKDIDRMGRGIQTFFFREE